MFHMVPYASLMWSLSLLDTCKLGLTNCIFGLVHEFWTIVAASMTYTRSRNYTNMMVGEHKIQTFADMIVPLLLLSLSFDVFVPTNAHPLLFFGKWFCQNTLKWWFLLYWYID